MANYLTAKRVGNMLYLSGVIAVDPTVRKVVTSYDDLPEEARKQLLTVGYNTEQMSVDIFEVPAAAQSWFLLNRIKDIVEAEGGQMKDVFKLVQYFVTFAITLPTTVCAACSAPSLW